MANGSILYVDAKQELPTALTEKLLAEFPTYCGAAFIVEGSAGVVLQQAFPSDLAKIQEMRAEFQDYPMILCFHKFDGEFHEDDSQPYIALASNNDEPILVVFMEGDFTPHALENSTRTPAYFALLNVIQKKLDQFNRLTKGNMEAILEEMATDDVKQDIASCVADRGSILLVPNVGDAISYDIENTQKFQADWGWCSNALGYKEGEFPQKDGEEEEKKEEVGPMTPQQRLHALAKGLAAKRALKKEPFHEATKPEEPQVTQVGDTKVIDTRKGSVPAVTSPGPFSAAPPKGMSHNKTKQWYENNAGFRPKEWHTRPMVTILPNRISAVKKEQGFLEDQRSVAVKSKSFSDIGGLLGIKPATDAPEKIEASLAAGIKAIDEGTFKKNVEPEHIKSSPVLPAKALETFSKEFMSNPMTQKWMKGTPPSMADLLAIENKLPNFYEQTGLQLDNLMTDEQIADVVYKHQDVAKLLIKTILVERAKVKADKALERRFSEAVAPAVTEKKTFKKKA